MAARCWRRCRSRGCSPLATVALDVVATASCWCSFVSVAGVVDDEEEEEEEEEEDAVEEVLEVEAVASWVGVGLIDALPRVLRVA